MRKDLTALYIILGVLLLIFLILLIRVQVFAKYTDALRLTLKVLFVRIRLIDPDKEKKPKKKKKKKPQPKKDQEPKKEEKKKEEKKENLLTRLKDKKGVTGILSLLSSLAELAGKTMKNLFSHIVIHKLDLGLSIKGEDAASTAVTYGRLCAVVYPSVNIITAVTDTKDYHVTVEPLFDDSKETSVYADVHAHIRVIWVVWEALKAAVKLLIIRIKL